MRAAFTGFGPFPGVADNPTSTLIEALCASDDPAFAACSFDVLDVEYEAVGPVLDRVLAKGPRALVMTGFSRNAATLQLESVASDARALSADAAGFVPAVSSAATTRLVCPHVDFAGLAAALNDCGIPTEVSRDAGQYVCNHAFYTALTRLAGADPAIPALFVHIPAIAGTELAQNSAAALPLGDLIRAMAAIAQAIAL